MASTGMTEHYHLNTWTGTDKPTRTDFVRDNLLLDAAIWEHANSTYKHLTNEEKERVSAPFCIKTVQGTDAAQRSITFDFAPKLVIYFAADEPPISVENGVVTVRCGFAAAGAGASASCSLGASALTVTHGTSNGVAYDLNSSGTQYIAVGIR